MAKITIGSDPEFGAVDAGGVPRSVIGLLGGSKKEPADIGNGCGVQEDNVMAELTIPPCESEQQFVDYIMYGKTTIDKMLNERAGYRIKSLSSARYDKKELNNKTARLFGCEPSFSIYTGEVSPRPTPQQVGNLRSAGTHIHVCNQELLDLQSIARIIFAMDVFLGVPSVIIDQDTQRRQLYGNPGDFRYKNILTDDNSFTIVEYRTLGGYLTDSVELLQWMYRNTIEAYNNKDYAIDNINHAQVKNIIEDGNVDAAIEFCKTNKISIPNVVHTGVWNLA